MKRKILLVGAGGHCSSVYDSVCALGIYDDIGVIVRDSASPEEGDGFPVVGSDSDLSNLRKNGWNEAIVTLGSIGNAEGRKRLSRMIAEQGYALAVIVDPNAVVAKDVYLGEGTYVGKKAIINAGVSIGKNVIINTGAIIEHNCKVGDYAHVSTGAILCGGVRLDKETHIGAGSVVRQMLSIGAKTMIGIGSVVVSDIPDCVTAYGNPCRVKEK